MNNYIVCSLGGILLGLASAAKFGINGRVLGISGMLKGMLHQPLQRQSLWRYLNVGGILLSSFLLKLVTPNIMSSISNSLEVDSMSMLRLIPSGLLVGFGSALANGCTSGHGITGCARFSKRSLIAIGLFMISGVSVATLFHTSSYTNNTTKAHIPITLAASFMGIFLALTSSIAFLYQKTFITNRSFVEGSIEIITGLAFGIGLLLTGMVNPINVLRFLDLSPSWDGSLMFVLGGALGTMTLAYWQVIQPLIKTKSTIISTDIYDIKKKNDITVQLLLGSIMFGVGWGISGMCPGPAIITLVEPFTRWTISLPAMAFNVSMFLGFILYNFHFN